MVSVSRGHSHKATTHRRYNQSTDGERGSQLSTQRLHDEVRLASHHGQRQLCCSLCEFRTESGILRSYFLQTPNKYMGIEDVPTRQLYRSEDQIRGLRYRLTLQDLSPTPRIVYQLPADALYPSTTSYDKYPHPVLLHWVYGVTAVHVWAEKNECYRHLTTHPEAITATVTPNSPHAQDDPRRTSEDQAGDYAATRGPRTCDMPESSSDRATERMAVMFGIMNKLARLSAGRVPYDFDPIHGEEEERVSRWSRHQPSLTASIGEASPPLDAPVRPFASGNGRERGGA